MAEDNRNGFDENAKQQIREYLHPPKPVQKPEEKPPLENWQKYMENGEYLRSSEISEEQNYNMIDGRRNNMPPKKTRTSVLVKLHQKQAEIAKTKRKGSTADGSGGRYGAQTEIKGCNVFIKTEKGKPFNGFPSPVKLWISDPKLLCVLIIC
mgnify:CR=1 FL=1